jgi:hypothetical protein
MIGVLASSTVLARSCRHTTVSARNFSARERSTWRIWRGMVRSWCVTALRGLKPFFRWYQYEASPSCAKFRDNALDDDEEGLGCDRAVVLRCIPWFRLLHRHRPRLIQNPCENTLKPSRYNLWARLGTCSMTFQFKVYNGTILRPLYVDLSEYSSFSKPDESKRLREFV